ncbi:hypothetical protein NE237_023339 [Protea cynaroides]|uniref:Methyltransferase n=1 Tax=Protea cynaroides TaxID=273540 RepID=A0A9Q0HEW6_9MAGN|nr:hypothetical protein NE237_023339 [Protea cynaroides]
MVVVQFFGHVNRPYRFCAKLIAVVFLGLCFVFVCSTFLILSSPVASQNSFSDIKENFSADEKGKDSRVSPKKREPGKEEAPKDDHRVESILEDKKEAANPKAKGTGQRADPVILNATHGSEGSRNEELQKVEVQGQIKQEEEVVDAEGDNHGVIEDDNDLNDSRDQETEENMEDEIEEPSSTGKKVEPVFDSRAKHTWKLCNVRSKYNYIPCIDFEHTTGKLKSYRHGERSCPRTPSLCLVPLPPGGYRPPVHWPESKSKILYGNVVHPKLTAFIKTRSWIKESEQYLTFPQDQSEFKGGVLNYIESIDEASVSHFLTRPL